MAGERFKSPVVSAVARRQLAFGPDDDSQQIMVPSSPVKQGQAVLSSPQKTFVQIQVQGGSQGEIWLLLFGR